MLGSSSFIPAYGPDGEERRHGRFALVDTGASGTDNLRKPCLPGSPAKVPASALIAERSAPPHQVDKQPHGEHTEGHGNPTGHPCRHSREAGGKRQPASSLAKGALKRCRPEVHLELLARAGSEEAFDRLDHDCLIDEIRVCFESAVQTATHRSQIAL
jgi:hypothetical protein